jgi:hypothetical protein
MSPERDRLSCVLLVTKRYPVNRSTRELRRVDAGIREPYSGVLRRCIRARRQKVFANSTEGTAPMARHLAPDDDGVLWQIGDWEIAAYSFTSTTSPPTTRRYAF